MGLKKFLLLTIIISSIFIYSCGDKPNVLEHKAWQHARTGLELLDEKDKVDEAIIECRRAIALRPKYAYAHAALCIVLQAKGRQNEALTECKKAIDLDSKNWFTHNALGDVLQKQGKIGEAIGEYLKALQLKPYSDNRQKNQVRFYQERYFFRKIPEEPNYMPLKTKIDELQRK